jgi:hypothetical protein
MYHSPSNSVSLESFCNLMIDEMYSDVDFQFSWIGSLPWSSREWSSHANADRKYRIAWVAVTHAITVEFFSSDRSNLSASRFKFVPLARYLWSVIRLIVTILFRLVGVRFDFHIVISRWCSLWLVHWTRRISVIWGTVVLKGGCPWISGRIDLSSFVVA